MINLKKGVKLIAINLEIEKCGTKDPPESMKPVGIMNTEDPPDLLDPLTKELGLDPDLKIEVTDNRDLDPVKVQDPEIIDLDLANCLVDLDLENRLGLENQLDRDPDLGNRLGLETWSTGDPDLGNENTTAEDLDHAITIKLDVIEGDRPPWIASPEDRLLKKCQSIKSTTREEQSHDHHHPHPDHHPTCPNGNPSRVTKQWPKRTKRRKTRKRNGVVGKYIRKNSWYLNSCLVVASSRSFDEIFFCCLQPVREARI